jgi:hypothetical protein
VAEITVTRVDYHAFRLKVTLTDGSTIRINEQYRRDIVEQYAYYWLDADSRLLIGCDNAPHHAHLSSFPHHTRIGSQGRIQPSEETIQV